MSAASILRLGYGAGGSAALVLRLGYLSSVSPAVRSVPGPSDGIDDGGRRRWLEWRDKKRRRAAVVERPRDAVPIQVTRPPPAPPVLERAAPRVIDITPEMRLLARNRAAMEAQRAALEEAERQRRDEEDVLALLLEDL